MMSAAVDSADLYSTSTSSVPSAHLSECCNITCDSQESHSSASEGSILSTSSKSQVDDPDGSVPQTPTSRVGFNLETDIALIENKERERYLTAKYPKHQMGLIRKRLAVEDWVDAELKRLFNISDEDYETYDTIIDLDELLNLDTDSQRSQFIQEKTAHAPQPTSELDKFTEELLKRANTL